MFLSDGKSGLTMADLATMKDKDGISGAEYKKALDALDKEVSVKLTDRVLDSMHNYLMYFGIPKDYPDVVTYSKVISTALLGYLLVGGYATLTDKGTGNTQQTLPLTGNGYL